MFLLKCKNLLKKPLLKYSVSSIHPATSDAIFQFKKEIDLVKYSRTRYNRTNIEL